VFLLNVYVDVSEETKRKGNKKNLKKRKYKKEKKIKIKKILNFIKNKKKSTLNFLILIYI
jgi:hypothetical protein